MLDNTVKMYSKIFKNNILVSKSWGQIWRRRMLQEMWYKGDSGAQWPIQTCTVYGHFNTFNQERISSRMWDVQNILACLQLEVKLFQWKW